MRLPICIATSGRSSRRSCFWLFAWCWYAGGLVERRSAPDRPSLGPREELPMAFALHLKHHAKFYAAAVLGVLVWLATAPLEAFMRILLAGDVFFLAHLLALAVLLSISREGTFRRRAEQEDDGIGLIALITIAALTLSLGSIFALLNHEQRVTAGHYVLALASVPLGWLMLHTVWSFHYAH